MGARLAAPSWLMAGPSLFSDLIWGAAAGLGVFVLALTGLMAWGARPQPLAAASFGGIALVVVYDLLTALVQESVFRGWLLGEGLRRLRGPAGPVLASGVSSLGFALIHLTAPDTTPSRLLTLLAFGFAACALTLRAGTIWPAVGFHAAWNLALSLGLGGPGAPGASLGAVIALGSSRLAGGPAGLEGSPLTLILCLGLAARIGPWRGPMPPPRRNAKA
ncbi:MAG: CPBP family intramembrane metalloprotease [Alphaproteobacteria bacterium]|nr:CPBP family intramembrane metalloprotease [Alphaproteobacteria bacterium]